MGCQAVSDVRQKWNAGQSSGCCRRRHWNNFRGMKAKTDPGEELTAPRMKARLPLLVSTRVIRGYSTALLGSHSKRTSHAVACARWLQYLCSPRLRLLSPPIVSCTIGLYESMY